MPGNIWKKNMKEVKAMSKNLPCSKHGSRVLLLIFHNSLFSL